MQNPISRPAAVDRRSFLAGAAAMVAAGAGGKLLAAETADSEDPGRWPMKLSCSSIAFASLPIEEACRRIAALGFEAIDVWSAYAGCPHLDDALNRLGPEGLTKLLASHRLTLYAFSVYVGGYRRYAELLGQAGGGVAVRGSAGPCPPSELTSRMKAFLESLKPELELAEKYNSSIAIENHGRALLDSLDSFKAFVDLNTHPRLGIALAPYHVQGLGESVEDAIRASGKQLLFFYAWQKAGGVAQLPGHGPTDCTPWLAALAKIGYGWYVNPFMHHEPPPEEMSRAMAQACQALRACYRKAATKPGSATQDFPTAPKTD